jgi:hypothetical protein
MLNRRRTRPLSSAGARLLDWITSNRTNVITFSVKQGLDPSAVYAWIAGRTPSLKHAVAIERATGVPCSAWVDDTQAAA